MPLLKIPLNDLEMEEQLERFLISALSSRRTATGIAKMLATCQRTQQEFVLQWVEAIAHSSAAELAYQFASHARQAFEYLDEKGIEAWVIHAMDIYDQKGLHPAIAILQSVAQFAQTQKAAGLTLGEIENILLTFLQGLSGRSLKLQTHSTAYTDTDTIFLPTFINYFSQPEHNFRLYKVIAVHLWAQTRFGTWRLNVHQALTQFSQPDKMVALFHQLERLRLDACIARELPGIYRDLNQVLTALGQTRIPPGWQTIAEHLTQPTATVQDSYNYLSQIQNWELPPTLCYQGMLMPEEVEIIKAVRMAKERELFRLGLVQLAQDHPELHSPLEPLETLQGRFTLDALPDEDSPFTQLTFELRLDGQPLAPPTALKSIIESIIQDLGKIPEEYLVPAGDGNYKHFLELPNEPDPSTVWQGIYHEKGAFLYHEWDYKRKHYRKDWCVLRELEVDPQPESFITTTLQRHQGTVKQLRRTFEMLRGENKLLKAQPNGEDIDLEALVKAYTEMKLGLEMDPCLFTKMYKEDRNIAVMLMIDMSGSTQGWINEAEREALVLLCEALEILGDRYAIYGFSGMTRKRCEIYKIKTFQEPYNNLVQQRISGIKPKDYTRMGVAIRHLTKILQQVEARIKLLITLSDGRPDDYGDNYRGQYGIEDTRQSLIEAKRMGIHPFCITLDTEAKDYLTHMYGAVNYIVIDEVRKLPLKVSDIYRKLTT